MKKYFICSWAVAILVSFQINTLAQTKTVSKNQITISITGIEYDDPSFGLLKESLLKNKNVTALKPGYDQGVAKITLSYPETAITLWEEIPKTTKEFFKLTTIDDTHIELTTKTAVAQNNNVTVNPSLATANKVDDDCKNCYWNMCNYDVVKSIGGKSYKGIIT